MSLQYIYPIIQHLSIIEHLSNAASFLAHSHFSTSPLLFIVRLDHTTLNYTISRTDTNYRVEGGIFIELFGNWQKSPLSPALSCGCIPRNGYVNIYELNSNTFLFAEAGLYPEKW